MFRSGIIVTLAMAVAAFPAQAQQADPQLTALQAALPGRLINDPTRLDWAVFGPDHANKTVKGTTSPGGAALQITIPRKGATLYEIGANAPITAEIKAGQRLVVAFYARTIKADTADGQGVIGVRFQQNAAPFPGFGDTRLIIGTEWKLYEMTAVADRSIAKGLAVIGFQLSGAKQVVEIGQTIVVEGAASIIAKGATTTVATPVMVPQLIGKGTLINNADSIGWESFGAAATHKTVVAKGMPGDTAVQYTVTAVGAHPYDAGANVAITEAIAEGDIMIVAVLARTISAETPDGLGKLGIRVQQNVAPYPGFGDHTLAIGPTWKLFQVKTRATMAIAKGQAGVGLHFAAAKQVIEIGKVYVLNGATP